MPQRISIIGDGSMATVCALLLEGRGAAVTVWGPFPDYIASLIQTRENRRYLPGYKIPTSVRFTADERQALRGADLIVSAVPTQFIRPVWEKMAEHAPAGAPIVSVAKGIEAETLLRPTQIVAEVLGRSDEATKRRSDEGTGGKGGAASDKRQAISEEGGEKRKEGREKSEERGAGVERRLVALSGPSVADELARCLPATVCAASANEELAAQVQQLFTTSWFRVYTNADVLGVELAGATKNVIALAAGILDGLHAGVNAKSALLSRGLAEITRLGVAMGAKAETFYGLAGVGDLADDVLLADGAEPDVRGATGARPELEDVLKGIPGIVEGVPTTRAVVGLAEKHGVDMPITQAVNQVLFAGLDPLEAIGRLMSRGLKAERVG